MPPSSNQCGSVVSMPGCEFSEAGGFSHEWLPRSKNGKHMFALLEVLTECCQLVMGVDISSVVETSNKGR